MTAESCIRFRPWIFGAARFILGAIFIYAAVSKIELPQDFADNIESYRLLPFAMIDSVALGLPLFEFACGVLVITGVFVRVGVLGICAMLAVFMVALALALARGLTLDCGCFGAQSWFDAHPAMALVRDGVLLGVALLIYRHCLRTTQR